MDSVIHSLILIDLAIYSFILMDPVILFIYFDGFCDFIH